MSSGATITVVVVDDQELVRAGLRALVDRTPGMTVVGEAADGMQALTTVRVHRPDVVLMDIRMPQLDGIAATRRICSDPTLVATRVVVLTTVDSEDDVVAALRAGAAGFVTKDSEPEVLRAGIRTVAGGESLLSPSVTTTVIRSVVHAQQLEPDPQAQSRVATLTGREHDVLLLVARGLTNDEIAAELVLSPASARTYVSRLMAKLDARDRVALVVLAHEARLV